MTGTPAARAAGFCPPASCVGADSDAWLASVRVRVGAPPRAGRAAGRVQSRSWGHGARRSAAWPSRTRKQTLALWQRPPEGVAGTQLEPQRRGGHVTRSRRGGASVAGAARAQAATGRRREDSDSSCVGAVRGAAWAQSRRAAPPVTPSLPQWILAWPRGAAGCVVAPRRLRRRRPAQAPAIMIAAIRWRGGSIRPQLWAATLVT